MGIVISWPYVKRYGEYHLRWQFSGGFMMIPMYYLTDLGLELWVTILVTQIFGAIAFWKLDEWIFSHKIEGE